jgi:hypothetical protein
VEANSTGGQGSSRVIAPNDDDDETKCIQGTKIFITILTKAATNFILHHLNPFDTISVFSHLHLGFTGGSFP